MNKPADLKPRNLSAAVRLGEPQNSEKIVR